MATKARHAERSKRSYRKNQIDLSYFAQISGRKAIVKNPYYPHKKPKETE